jgi:carbonic anhydrase
VQVVILTRLVTRSPSEAIEDIMDFLDTLLRRNKEFANDGFNPNLRMIASSKSLIIGCVDPRVDPMDIFKLQPGEAAVFRNIGGRVNPALMETLAILRAVTHAAGGNIGPASNLIVLHHTDCGIKVCYRHAPELLAKHMGVALTELDALAVTDPRNSVALDIAALRANPEIPGGYTVSGFVYDVATGMVETIVPPTMLRPDET